MKNYFDEMMQAQQFGSYLTGVCTAFIKYSDISESDKKMLAKNLLWCHKQAKTEASPLVMEAVKTVLSEKEIEGELNKNLAF